MQIDEDMEDEVVKEMNKVVEVVCTTHRLPFAQIWMPCSCSDMNQHSTSENSFYTSDVWGMNRFQCLRPNGDMGYHSLANFKAYCNNHILRKGHGVVGRALLYRKPYFCADVSQLPIADYPFSHYAREYGFSGCFAICLHTTTLTKKQNDYALELFLPRWNTTSGDPQTLLASIFTTVKNHLQGSEICLAGPGKESYVEVLNISKQDEHDSFKICQSIGIQPISERSLQDEREEEVPNKVTGEVVIIDSDGQSDLGVSLEEEMEKNVGEELCVEVAKTAKNVDITTVVPPMTETLQNEIEFVQLSSDDDSAMEAGGKNELKVNASLQRISSRGEASDDRVYRTTDISLSRDDLIKYFGKKLDDAAHNLGVSRSTMKRACRVHGIKKWPSPKRKKIIQPSPSNLNHVSAFIQGSNEQVPKFCNSEPSCSNSPPKRKKVKPSPINVSHINEFFQDGGGVEQIPKFVNNEPSDQPPMHATGVVPQTIPNVKAKQDEGSVTVKATYGVQTIKFRLSFSSTMADLMEEVSKRLPLKDGTFYINYEDDDGDWVLIACDEDVEECIRISKSKSIIK